MHRHTQPWYTCLSPLVKTHRCLHASSSLQEHAQCWACARDQEQAVPIPLSQYFALCRSPRSAAHPPSALVQHLMCTHASSCTHTWNAGTTCDKGVTPSAAACPSSVTLPSVTILPGLTALRPASTFQQRGYTLQQRGAMGPVEVSHANCSWI